ncbi:MAG TPA: hypothetical protein DCM86_00355 [Verrucomicrobiales bacterium]|nr:hypothetical protein [Verrucomicrobiales bacterium]
MRTKTGLRLSQHGVVISELRTIAGPTHSLFDLLAALIHTLAPTGRVGILGFAGGGMVAPLRALGVDRQIASVDLDREAYELFRRECPAWVGQVAWSEGDAADWLERQRRPFDLIVEDLSIPQDGDVFKPSICWEGLPRLIASRLAPHGVAVFNLLKPAHGRWNPEFAALVARFSKAHLLGLEEFENRIVVAGSRLPSARALGGALRRGLRGIRSRQAGRLRVQRLDPPGPTPYPGR